MSKILLIGDPHLKVTHMDRNVKFLASVLKAVKLHKPDVVVNLGDTFDTHAVVRSEVVSIFRQHLLDISAISKYIYVVGNHDCVKNNDISRHALQPFIGYNNVTIVDKTTDIDGVTYVPYVHDDGDFPKQTQKICICHQTIRGVDYGFYIPDSGVDADSISAEMLISGHVHLKQSFGKTTYVGSPYASGVADVDQSKGLHLFDTETREFTFLPSELPSWKRLKYTLNTELTATQLIKQIKIDTNEVDCFVVELTGAKADISKLLGAKRFQEIRDVVSIVIKTVFLDKIKNQRIQIESVKPVDILSSYIDKVYAGEVDKSILKDRINGLFS